MREEDIKYINELESRVQELEDEIKSHAPEGRNYTNKQYVDLLHENKRYREVLEESYAELRQLHSSLEVSGASSNDLGVLEYVGLTLIKQALDKIGGDGMTLDHEAYFYRTVYAVILESPDGGQRMNTFVDENKARADAELLIESIKESGKEGFKVLLTPLEYSQRKNLIMTENIVTEETEILYGGDDE